MPDYEIDVGVVANPAAFPAELEALIGKAEARTPPVQVGVLPKLAPGFQRDAKAQVKEALARIDAQVVLTPRLAKSFRTDVEKLITESTRGTGVEIPIQAKLGPGFRAKLQRLVREETLTKPIEALISPVLDQRAYARFTTDLRGRMEKASAEGVTAVQVRPELVPGFTEELSAKVRTATEAASAEGVVRVRADTTAVEKQVAGLTLAGTGKELSKKLTVPILAIGAAAIYSATQVDAGYQIIEQRTGATGARLKELDGVYDAVNEKSAASMTHVADVVAQFDQRLGITGQPLKDLTKEFLILERVAGDGRPTVEQSAKVMVAWRVATADQATELDHLFVASQRTGVPVATLMDDVTKFAPIMHLAGESIDETTVLMGLLEKQGVPVSKAMMGVNTYLAKVAKAGDDTHGVIQKVIDQAVGLNRTGHSVEAATLLVTAFGSKAGPAVAELVREGKLSGPVFDALVKDISGARGEIERVGNATVPLSVKLGQARKEIEVALAPIGNQLIPDMLGALHMILPVIDSVLSGFAHLPAGARTAILTIMAIGAAAGPAMVLLSPLIKILQILWITMQAAGYGAQIMAAKIAAADTTLAGLGEAATAALGPLGLVVAVVGAVYLAWHQRSEEHKKDVEAIKSMTDVTVADVKRLGVSVGAAFKADVLKGLPDDMVKAARSAHISLDDLDSGLSRNGKSWDEWRKTTVHALSGDELHRMVYGKILDVLKKAYDGAAQATKGLGTAQERFAIGLATTGKSVQAVTSDALKLQDAVSSAEFKKSGLAPEMLISDMKLLGLTVQDVTRKGFDWSQFKKDVDGMNKYLDGVTKTWAGFTDLLSIDTPTTEKKIQAAKDAVTKAQAGVAASADKANAAIAASDQKLQVKKLRGNDALIRAQDALNKVLDNPKSKPEAIAAAERRLQIAQESAKAISTGGRAAAGSAGSVQRLADAQKKLADLQESVGVDGIKKFYKERLFEAGTFVSDVHKAWAMGYDPGLISRIITAGPEKAGQQLHTLVSTSSGDLVKIVNEGEKQLQAITAMALEQAHLQELAMHPIKADPTGAIGRFMRANVGAASLADKFTSDAKPLTVYQLAQVTGLTPENAEKLAVDFQLPFLKNPPINGANMRQQIWDFKNGIANDPPLVIKVDADTLPGHQSVRALKDNVDGTRGAITIDGVAIPAIEKLTGTVVKVNASKGTVTLDADQRAALLKLIAWQTHTKKSKGTVGLDADPSAANKHIKELNKTISQIPFVGSALAKALNATGPLLGPSTKITGTVNAHGNVFEDHSPHIARSLRIFGEPETEGESYIPHAKSKRKRSLALWAQTGQILGVPGFKDGGVMVDGNAVAAPLIGRLTNAIDSIGGQRVLDAQAFAQAQVGKPYVWGAVGPDAYDCSGLWSAIVNVAMGADSPYRRLFTSATLPSVAASLGLLPGTGGPLAIGDLPSSHVAGTLAGVNFEATPPRVLGGPSARGAASPFFSQTFNLPLGAFVKGSNLPSVTGGDFGAAGGLGGGPIPALGSGLLGRILGTIGWMESRDNPTARNPNGSASGMFQYTDGTWGGFGGFPSAFMAPLIIQIAKATMDVGRDLAMSGGDVSAIPEYWYLGHRASAAEMARVPAGGNRLTPSEYDAEWMAAFSRVQGFKDGGLVTRDGLYRMAEQNKPELVMPLTQPSRMRQLAEEHGITDMLSGSSRGQAPLVTVEPGGAFVQVVAPNSDDAENYGMAVGHRMVPVLASAIARIGAR